MKIGFLIFGYILIILGVFSVIVIYLFKVIIGNLFDIISIFVYILWCKIIFLSI